ncbi:MAG TPA: cell division protein, partial [Chryseosolibacter sp.]|nr:cell division protein [Chryseosolibacter sp.]
FKYPNYFRDEMTRGPFKKIKHDHWFGLSGSATIMRETFEFESPGGVLGKIFNRLILQRYLMAILKNRNKLIKAVAEGEQWKTLLNT